MRKPRNLNIRYTATNDTITDSELMHLIFKSMERELSKKAETQTITSKQKG